MDIPHHGSVHGRHTWLRTTWAAAVSSVTFLSPGGRWSLPDYGVRVDADDGLQVLLLADTHVPKRARDLPAEVWDRVDAADVVVHAGDWVVPELLDRLEARSARLVGVWGNNDGPDLRRRLPEVARVELRGMRWGVVHETGARARREERMRAAYPDLDVLVFGHSHIPWDTEHEGLRLLNPGSPTDRRREPSCTYMTCTVAGALREVTLHRL
jgi:uncharacterized protein